MNLADPRTLVGTWRLARTLTDRYAGVTGSVTGTLALAASDEGLTWSETGTLTWEGRDHPVTRLLRLTCEPDGWLVRFEHGGAFHPWRPGEPVVHPCRADTHRGVVRSAGAEAWTVVWEVTGPTTDYTSATTLTR